MAIVKDFQSYRRKREGYGKETAEEKNPQEFSEDIPDDASEEDGGKGVLGKLATPVVLALTIALAAVLAASAYLTYNDRVYTDVRETDSSYVLMSQNVQVCELNGTILQYSVDGAGCVDVNGTSLWNRTYQMQSPIIRTCGDVAAIADYNGRTIHVANKSGVLGEIRTNLPVRTFSVASRGVVAAVLDDTDITWINLFDTEGNELATFKTTMEGSGYPLAVAISPNGQLVAVSYLTAKSAQSETNLAFYNFGSVGQNKVDNLTGGYSFPGTVAPLVRFMNNSVSYAVCTDRIVFFSGDQVPRQQSQTLFNSGEVLAVYEGDNEVGLLFGSDEGEDAYRLDVFNGSGERFLQMPLEKQYAHILFTGNRIVLYDSEEWKVTDRDGNVRYEGRFEYPVSLVMKGRTDSRFYLVTSDSIRAVELK